MTRESKGQVVVTSDNKTAVYPLISMPTSPQKIIEDGDFYTNIQPDDKKGHIALFRAMNASKTNGDTWINKVFTIEHVAVFPKVYPPNQDGEIYTAVCTSIITTLGELIHFRSAGVLQSINAMAKCDLLPPSRKGVEFTLRRVSFSASSNMYQLSLAEELSSVPPKK